MKEVIKVSNNGAHIYHWHPSIIANPVLFCSKNAIFEAGKPIRGGIPICWPWFGPKDGKRQHGFVRVADWKMESQEHNGDDGFVILKLYDRDVVDADFKFELIYEIRYSQQYLQVTLTTVNLDDHPLALSQALHTYLAIGDIGNMTINGCDGHSYIDKTDFAKIKIQDQAIIIQQEIDRIYLNTDRASIFDFEWDRIINVTSDGASDIVIWNPWEEKSQEIADLADEEYNHFICVEVANASQEIVINPGEQYLLSSKLNVVENLKDLIS